MVMNILKAFPRSSALSLAALLVSTQLIGVAEAQTNPLKIGYVNANQIIADAPQGKAAFEQIKDEFAAREEALRQTQTQLDDLRTQLAEETETATRREIEDEFRRINRNFERDTIGFEEDFNYRRNEELARLQDLVSEVILQMADEMGFDLIVQEPVVWASDRINITDEILKKLEELHQGESQ